MMRSEMLNRMIAKPVKDIYGRYVGCVVGLAVDTSGQMKAIGVDMGSGNFAEYPVGRIISDDDSLIIIPEWKTDAEKLGKDRALTEKRTKALEELRRSGEISGNVYDELYNQYGEDFEKLQDSYSALKEALEKRVAELFKQNQGLERFLAGIKVQFRTGEIDEETFKAMSEYVTSMLSRNASEQRDITLTQRALTLHEAGEVKAAAHDQQTPAAEI